MKTKWINLNLGQKILCILQAVLICVFGVAYAVRQMESPGLSIGCILCIVNVVSVLYADEMFRWKIRGRVAEPEKAVPSKTELASRWVGWILCTALSLFLFIFGLTGM